jgi:hypothetical protein
LPVQTDPAFSKRETSNGNFNCQGQEIGSPALGGNKCHVYTSNNRGSSDPTENLDGDNEAVANFSDNF